MSVQLSSSARPPRPPPPPPPPPPAVTPGTDPGPGHGAAASAGRRSISDRETSPPRRRYRDSRAAGARESEGIDFPAARIACTFSAIGIGLDAVGLGYLPGVCAIRLPWEKAVPKVAPIDPALLNKCGPEPEKEPESCEEVGAGRTRNAGTTFMISPTVCRRETSPYQNAWTTTKSDGRSSVSATINGWHAWIEFPV